MAAASVPSLPPPPVVIQRQYNDLLQECQRLSAKIAELEVDRNEHKLVEETLRPLDPHRRAYRLVGQVLVERTVQEVLPSVTSNRQNVSHDICVCFLRYEGHHVPLYDAAFSRSHFANPTVTKFSLSFFLVLYAHELFRAVARDGYLDYA
jgi:prefoldin subunit 2